MKKIFVLAAVIALMISISGCSTDKKDSKQEKTLTLESGKFSKENKDVFEEFVNNTENGKTDSVILEYLEDGSPTTKAKIAFDGKEYTYNILNSSETVSETYKYLRYFEGEYKDEYTYADYVLTNDKEMTYDSLQNTIISSDLEESQTEEKNGFRYILAEHAYNWQDKK